MSHQSGPGVWHPDGGYGFFCRPSCECVGDSYSTMDRPTTLLLKLHGSINWRYRLGESLPLSPAGILHHEAWLPPSMHSAEVADRIEAHLEPDPLIVPPVLIKSALTEHPVLRVVWEHAYQRLREATRVVFMGYSLPKTDLASRVLFRETLLRRSSPPPEIQVVSRPGDEAEQEEITTRYRSMFPAAQFEFSGAKAWVARQEALRLPPVTAHAVSEPEGAAPCPRRPAQTGRPSR
jgi:hypothetical protein